MSKKKSLYDIVTLKSIEKSAKKDCQVIDKIFDEVKARVYAVTEVQQLLNTKDQRIKELEEQLANAIVPKFKVGDKVYAIIDNFAYTDVLPVEIRDNHLLYEVWDGQDTTKQHCTRIFATKEEAEAKLKEMMKDEHKRNDTKRN